MSGADCEGGKICEPEKKVPSEEEITGAPSESVVVKNMTDEGVTRLVTTDVKPTLFDVPLIVDNWVTTDGKTTEGVLPDTEDPELPCEEGTGPVVETDVAGRVVAEARGSELETAEVGSELPDKVPEEPRGNEFETAEVDEELAGTVPEDVTGSELETPGLPLEIPEFVMTDGALDGVTWTTDEKLDPKASVPVVVKVKGTPVGCVSTTELDPLGPLTEGEPEVGTDGTPLEAPEAGTLEGGAEGVT